MPAKIPEVGENAPDFTLSAENGTGVNLNELLKAGNNLLLVFYRGHW